MDVKSIKAILRVIEVTSPGRPVSNFDQNPLTPTPLSPKGARGGGNLNLLPSVAAATERGPQPALSPARQPTVPGEGVTSEQIANYILETH
jgi:hypothetical protein